jgi:hypothetical protein
MEVRRIWVWLLPIGERGATDQVGNARISRSSRRLSETNADIPWLKNTALLIPEGVGRRTNK